MRHKPQKRHKALQTLSRDHHHGLLLSWKIRSGLSKNIAPQRIGVYVHWFFKTHLLPHFELEEQHIFPILGSNNELITKALDDHDRLKDLFSKTDKDAQTLSNIEKGLEQHIRFEERVLFPEIQKAATEEQLMQIEKIHQQGLFEDKLDDEFWK
jgi:iron-sulfur cluster repair protein YtfE (RIC family)